MFKGRKVPHTYVIVFGFIVVAAILTWIVPGGSYERETPFITNRTHESERVLAIYLSSF